MSQAGGKAVAREAAKRNRQAIAEGRAVAKVEAPRSTHLNTLGEGKLTFRMVVRIQFWQARSRRRPVPKGKVFVEKLVNVATSQMYGPQTGPRAELDPVKLKWMELNDVDYFNQRSETRKAALAVKKDVAFLTECFEGLDSSGNSKLTADELEHWAALLLADHGEALDKVHDHPNGALRHWMGSDERGTLSKADGFDIQVKLGKAKLSREALQYDWQDFLIITLDFYLLVGTRAMHRTFCELMGDDERPVRLQDDDTDRPQGAELEGPPPVRLPRSPVKARLQVLAPVVQAGSWDSQQSGARGRSRPKNRQPRLPLPPVSNVVLGPRRPVPLRAHRLIPAIGPGTPKRELAALRARPPATAAAESGKEDDHRHAATTRHISFGDERASAGTSDPDMGEVKQKWTEYKISHNTPTYIGSELADKVQQRVEEGVLPEVFRKLAVQSARPARRVTELMSRMHAGEQAAGRSSEDEYAKDGWANNLPVVIIPGLCSSGLEVVKSDVKPDWKDQRVWFSIEKLGQQRNAVTRLAAEGVKLAAAPVRILNAVIGEVGNLPQNLATMVAGVQGVVGGNTMRFHLHRARDLTAADTNGSADPHVRVQILGVDGDVLHEQISAVKTTTREPYWNQDIDLGSHISMVDIESVRLVMLDYDGLSSSEYMGEVDLPLPAEFWTRNVPVLPRGWHHLVDTRKLNSSLKNRSRNRSRTITSDIGRGLQAITSGAVGPVQLVVSGQVECWAHVVNVDLDGRDIIVNSSDEAEADLMGRHGETPRARKQQHVDGASLQRYLIDGDGVELVEDLTHLQKGLEAAVGNMADDGHHVMELTSDGAQNLAEGAAKGLKRDVAKIVHAGGRARALTGALTGAGAGLTEQDEKEEEEEANAAAHSHVTTKELQGLDRKMWLRHMALGGDGHSDPPGIEVRAVQGLAGVDYLQPGHVMGATTWVFGQVIDFLRARGYDDSNLRGAPYDWRMPPGHLQKRDRYFSELCETIEELSRDNGGKPVVLLAHSMGNNMAHYFLNWVVQNGHNITKVPGAKCGFNGPAWLDKYIYSLFGISGPYLGATSALKASICGDDFGMGPALLPQDDARQLCQAMGSGAWLLPTGRLADQLHFRGLVYERVDHKTETSVKLGEGVNGGNYEPRGVSEALRGHGAAHVADQRSQWYDLDHCIPGGTSGAPPPISRVFHCYGVNLDTEVAFAVKGGESPDLDTTLNKGRFDGDRYRSGVIYETSDSSQDTFHTNATAGPDGKPPEPTHLKRSSGDGTVPYVSLQQTLSWNSQKCLSQNVELDRSEHREILADTRFHQVLGDYLCDTLVVYVIAARNLAAKDLVTRSSDPYAIVTVHTGMTNPQRVTKTHPHTLNPEFNEVFTFGSSQATGTGMGDTLENARVVSIEVRDSDFGGMSSDHIGTVVIPFATILNSPTRAVNGWFKLMPEDSAKMPDLISKADMLHNGEIFVQFELETAGQCFRGVPDYMDLVYENMRTFDEQSEIRGSKWSSVVGK